VVRVRTERRGDHAAARGVNERAFGASSGEAALVDALRAEGAHVPDLCLVAVDGDAVVGHLFVSRARLGSGDDVLALAPMAVAPERQRGGVGSLLVEEALRRAAATAFPLVVLAGHPGFYPRFGFEPAAALGVVAPFEIPGEAWLAYRLPAYRPQARGTVTYASAFDALI
jgi:putative acetyltransferase